MVLTWNRWLLVSYALWLKRELIDRTGSADEQSRRLFFSPFVVVSYADSAIYGRGSMDLAPRLRR